MFPALVTPVTAGTLFQCFKETGMLHNLYLVYYVLPFYCAFVPRDVFFSLKNDVMDVHIGAHQWAWV